MKMTRVASVSTRRWSLSSPHRIPTPATNSSRSPRTVRRWFWICYCDALWHLGARLANPGEFTERAFLAGKLDLTQAEAVRDLIDAQTLTQARQAASQMGGALSRRVAPTKQSLVELIALLEAGIDFAEDDVDVAPQAEIARRIAEIVPPLAALEASFARGRIVHDGLTHGNRRPPQRRQELSIQSPCGTRPRHRHRHSREPRAIL